MAALAIAMAAAAAGNGGSGQPSISSQLRRGIRAQIEEQIEERGESITIMVVGESGQGKTCVPRSRPRTSGF